MSQTGTSMSQHKHDASVGTVDMKLEVIVIPVSDVDRAKEFYRKLGWRLDADYDSGKDFRVLQFTPPGSGCSIIFGNNVTAAAPGSAQGLYLIVSDIERPALSCWVAASRSARCSMTPAAYTVAQMSPTCVGGNGSAVGTPSIAATARSPRSMIPTATVGCSRRSRRGCPGASTQRQRPSHRRCVLPPQTRHQDLASALRRAAAAHGEHEKRIGGADANWPDWYAE